MHAETSFERYAAGLFCAGAVGLVGIAFGAVHLAGRDRPPAASTFCRSSAPEALIPTATGTGEIGPVSVPADVSGGQICVFYGMNGAHARQLAWGRQLTKQEAQDLRAAILESGRVRLPEGSVSFCPADDSSRARVRLAETDGASSDVEVMLSGCADVRSASGNNPRGLQVAALVDSWQPQR